MFPRALHPDFLFSLHRYSVIGEDNLPNPDYWSAVLWHRLVGSRVLSVEGGLEPGRAVRAYAFCQAGTDDGGVALVVLNTLNSTRVVSANLQGPRNVYMLTSYPGQIFSRDVFLNGKVLRLANESTGELPDTPPVALSSDQPLELPAFSYGFVLFPKAHASACIG